eukprot:3249166-Rhodomonas_salina.1
MRKHNAPAQLAKGKNVWICILISTLFDARLSSGTLAHSSVGGDLNTVTGTQQANCRFRCKQAAMRCIETWIFVVL